MKLLAKKYRLCCGMLPLILGAAWGLFAPAPVKASCGNYVVYPSKGGNSENPSHPLESLPQTKPSVYSSSIFFNRHTRTNHPMPGGKRCSQPGCQSAPQFPGTVVPPSSSPSQNQLIWHKAGSRTNDRQVGASFLDFTEFELSPYRSSIFHPPR